MHVDGISVPVRAGDVAFVPRWMDHRTENTGDDELVILAVTDFRLTSKLFLGDPTPHTRASGTEAAIDS